MWDPGQYLRFADERGRPFLELVARIGAAQPTRVVDLGCGPGNLTALLHERWPEALVLGVDSSPAMVERAQADVAAAVARFELGDVATWAPVAGEEPEVVVSNATLHWIPDHLPVIERIVGWLPPGGWFAFQVPGNFDAPSHRSIVEVRTSERWRDRLGEGAGREAAVRPPSEYVHLLHRLGCCVDAWETTYLHVLTGEDPVLQWVMGTALRPALARLPDEADRRAFLAEVAERLRAAYPATPHGTVFPFRRIFVVAERR